MSRKTPLLLTSLAMLALVAVTAVAFAPSGILLWFSLVLGALLVALSVLDMRTLTLPDPLNLAVFALGALMVWQTRPDAWPHHLIGAFAGYTLTSGQTETCLLIRQVPKISLRCNTRAIGDCLRTMQ